MLGCLEDGKLECSCKKYIATRLSFFAFCPPARHREPLRRGGRVSAESKKNITLCALRASSEAGGE